MTLDLEFDLGAIEANRIHEGLWQGSRPPSGYHVKEAGFRLLVLCAREYQPPAEHFLGVEVIHAPNDDNAFVRPSREVMKKALEAAHRVAEVVREGGQALVTCWAGINRSGLVSALALHKLLGVSGLEAREIVRFARPNTLTNPQFVACLGRVGKAAEPNPRHRR